jgi:hypothetical protein
MWVPSLVEFFYTRPLFLFPAFDLFFVALQSASFGLLRSPTEVMHQATDVIRVISTRNQYPVGPTCRSPDELAHINLALWRCHKYDLFMFAPHLLALVTLAIVASCDAATPRPIVLTTDCGADMDDQWALAHIVLTPEFERVCKVVGRSY